MEPHEYAPFYAGYVALVPETDVLAVLSGQISEAAALARGFSRERELFRYAPGKWSVREVVGHVSDAERVFGYRALCIARGEAAPLPGYDEDSYLAAAQFDRVPLRDLIEEFALARRSNLAFLARLDAAALARVGNANGAPVSVRALTRILAGHARHHFAVLRERYGAAG